MMMRPNIVQASQTQWSETGGYQVEQHSVRPSWLSTLNNSWYPPYQNNVAQASMVPVQEACSPHQQTYQSNVAQAQRVQEASSQQPQLPYQNNVAQAPRAQEACSPQPQPHQSNVAQASMVQEACSPQPQPQPQPYQSNESVHLINGIHVSIDSFNNISMKLRRRFSLLVREVTRGLFSQDELSKHSALGKRLKIPGSRPGLDPKRMTALSNIVKYFYSYCFIILSLILRNIVTVSCIVF